MNLSKMKIQVILFVSIIFNEVFSEEENLKVINKNRLTSHKEIKTWNEIPIFIDINNSELPENPPSVKHKRCLRNRLGSPLVGSSSSSNSIPSDDKKTHKLYETFCKTCVIRHNCKNMMECQVCEKWCTQTPNMCPEVDAKGDDQSGNGETLALANRGNFDENEEEVELKKYTITLNRGNLMEIILSLLGVYESKDVESMIITVHSKGAQPIILNNIEETTMKDKNGRQLEKKLKDLKNAIKGKLQLDDKKGLDYDKLDKLLSKIITMLRTRGDNTSDNDGPFVVGSSNDADPEVASRFRDPLHSKDVIHQSLMNPDIIEDSPDMSQMRDERVRTNSDLVGSPEEKEQNVQEPSDASVSNDLKDTDIVKSPNNIEDKEVPQRSRMGAVSSMPLLEKLRNIKFEQKPNEIIDRLRSQIFNKGDNLRESSINNGARPPTLSQQVLPRNQLGSYNPNLPHLNHESNNPDENLARTSDQNRNIPHQFKTPAEQQNDEVGSARETHISPTKPNNLKSSEPLNNLPTSPNQSPSIQFNSGHNPDDFSTNHNLYRYNQHHTSDPRHPNFNSRQNPDQSIPITNNNPSRASEDNSPISRSNVPEQISDENNLRSEKNNKDTQVDYLEDNDTKLNSPQNDKKLEESLLEQGSPQINKKPEDNRLSISESNDLQKKLGAKTSEIIRRIKDKQDETIKRLNTQKEQLEKARKNVLGLVKPNDNAKNVDQNLDKFEDVASKNTDDILGSQPLENSFERFQPGPFNRHLHNHSLGKVRETLPEEDPLDALNSDSTFDKETQQLGMSAPEVNSRGQFDNGYSLGRIIPANNENISFTQPTDIFFMGDGIKLPLQMVKKSDGAVHFSVDVDKLCTSCPRNQTAKELEQTVEDILEKEAELKNELENFDDSSLGMEAPNSKSEGNGENHRNQRYSNVVNKFVNMKNRIANRFASDESDGAKLKRSVKDEDISQKEKFTKFFKDMVDKGVKELKETMSTNQAKTNGLLQKGKTKTKKIVQKFKTLKDNNENVIPISKMYQFKGLEDKLAKKMKNIEKSVDNYSKIDDRIFENESAALNTFNEDPVIRQEVGLVTEFLGFLKKLAVDSTKHKYK